MRPANLFCSIVAACALGCGSLGGSPQGGGETHWLRACQSDSQCAAPASDCVCGVCTHMCESDDACAADSNTGCVAPGSASQRSLCGESAATESSGDGMCLPRCDDDADCAAFGASYACVDGHCARHSEMPGEEAPDGGETTGPDADVADASEPYDPCAGKSCGERCSLCAPDDPDCVETAVLKYCDASGRCDAVEPDCGGDEYDPCAGKSCGDTCRICAPDDDDCVETTVEKYCDASGRCDSTQPDCSGEEYDPCAGKSCGERCSVCAPDDPDCVETAVLKYCDTMGRCGASSPSC